MRKIEAIVRPNGRPLTPKSLCVSEPFQHSAVDCSVRNKTMKERSIYFLLAVILLLMGLVFLIALGKSNWDIDRLLYKLEPEQIVRDWKTPKPTLDQSVQAMIHEQNIANGEFYFVVAWSEEGGVGGLEMIRKLTTPSRLPQGKALRSSFSPSSYRGNGSYMEGSGSCIFVWASKPEGIDQIQAELEEYDAANNSFNVLMRSGVMKSEPAPANGSSGSPSP